MEWWPKPLICFTALLALSAFRDIVLFPSDGPPSFNNTRPGSSTHSTTNVNADAKAPHEGDEIDDETFFREFDDKKFDDKEFDDAEFTDDEFNNEEVLSSSESSLDDLDEIELDYDSMPIEDIDVDSLKQFERGIPNTILIEFCHS